MYNIKLGYCSSAFLFFDEIRSKDRYHATIKRKWKNLPVNGSGTEQNPENRMI